MKKFKDNIKFSFTPDFQLEILRFVLRDKEGGLILKGLKLITWFLLSMPLYLRVYQNTLRSKVRCLQRMY